MQHLVDKEVNVPFTCWDCRHFCDRNMNCAAFDVIPDRFMENAENHTSVVEGQKGTFVFETDKERDTMRAYVLEDFD